MKFMIVVWTLLVGAGTAYAVFSNDLFGVFIGVALAVISCCGLVSTVMKIKRSNQAGDGGHHGR